MEEAPAKNLLLALFACQFASLLFSISASAQAEKIMYLMLKPEDYKSIKQYCSDFVSRV